MAAVRAVIELIRQIDPWGIVAGLLVTLLYAEMRYASRQYMRGMAHGYDVAARQANERDAITEEEAVPVAFIKEQYGR